MKSLIEKRFIEARKNRNTAAMSALSMLKAKITETEKIANTELTDVELLKVINSLVKRYNQSIEAYAKGNRTDLVEKETAELSVLEYFLPKQLTEVEIVAEVKVILEESGLSSETNMNKLVGQLTGMFNKKFVGKFDQKLLQKVISDLLVTK